LGEYYEWCQCVNLIQKQLEWGVWIVPWLLSEFVFPSSWLMEQFAALEKKWGFKLIVETRKRVLRIALLFDSSFIEGGMSLSSEFANQSKMAKWWNRVLCLVQTQRFLNHLLRFKALRIREDEEKRLEARIEAEVKTRAGSTHGLNKKGSRVGFHSETKAKIQIRFTITCQSIILGWYTPSRATTDQRNSFEVSAPENLLKTMTRFTNNDSFHLITIESPQQIHNSFKLSSAKWWLVSRESWPVSSQQIYWDYGPLSVSLFTIQNQIASEARARRTKTEQIFSTKQPDQISTKLNEIWTQDSLPMCD
jgi:hypothetical protein